jgi:transposase-like protein
MSKGKRRVYSRDLKVTAVERLLAGERAAALSRELRVPAGQLYKWCTHYRRGGPEALRPAHRPYKVLGAVEVDPAVKAQQVTDIAAARKRIVALERKIGQQQLELDFFQQALRQVGQARQPNDGLGVPASVRSSRRRRPGRKAS